jgi:pectinesterase
MSQQITRRKTTILLLMLACLSAPPRATGADITAFAKQPDEWFKSDEGKRVLDNVLTWQTRHGRWWKAYDPTKPNPDAKTPPKRDERYPAQDQNLSGDIGTFDNKATWSELRLLARAVTLTKEQKYRDAFDRGLEFVFRSQYPNGGWPQRFPLEDNYGRHITYNDDAMVQVMYLVRDVAAGQGDLGFVPEEARRRAKGAFDKGVDCILATQIKVDGKPTVWCAQHDEKTLAPTKARAYELPSFSGGESASIALLLMSIENPDDRVKRAVHGAATWYEQHKLTGIRLEQKPDKSLPKGFDVSVVEDPSAPPLWGRFYDLETGKPYFCGRDGVKKSSLAEIEGERRSGYAWLRPWGKPVLDAYPKWAAKHGMPTQLASAAAAAPAASTNAPAAPPAPAAASASGITVAADGSGSFKTVQAAIESVPAKSAQPVTIHIKPGTYKERIRIPKDKPFITLRGDDAKTTILTYDLHAKSVLPGETKEVGTSGSYSTLIEADDFTAENLTFENPSGHIAQAVALRTTGQRQAFFNCRMLGGQDTLYLHDGLAYFKDCYIEGRVDFIFGRGIAAFEDCHIHSKNGGYVTAAATEPDKQFGYLFLRCKLTGEGDKALLGRPWRPHAAVAFIKCEIGDHIRPEGWDNWRKAENEKTARYVEFGNTGPGADTSKRVGWARQLSADEAAKYTVENVLGDWKPSRGMASSAK